MAGETFSPTFSTHPDFQAAADWSGGIVPVAGGGALINAVDAWVDPLANIAASVTLEGGAALIGNQSGFALSGTLIAFDDNALYANGAIINQGVMAVAGSLAMLDVVVQAGADIAAHYGLAIPSFENTGTININAGAAFNISGTEFSNLGTVDINGAALSVDGGWVDGGQGAGPSGGVFNLTNGGLASFNDGVSNQNFIFSGPASIIFNDPLDVSNIAITNFGYRDAIITTSTAAANALLSTALSFTNSPPPDEVFVVRPTANGAEILLENDNTPPCFAAGTHILTTSGPVAVEHLNPGDHVITASGHTAPIRWIGWRSINLACHSRPDAVSPIRITAGALAPAIPARDLFLSPDHALFLHGHLVPAKLLLNGVTIRRETDCASVTYFHIELDRHDIILAENLAVETYLDTGNRNAFANAQGSPHAAPVFGRGRQWNDFACADLCLSGPLLQTIRREIFQRTRGLGYQVATNFRIELHVDDHLIGQHDAPAHAAEFTLPPQHHGPLFIRSAAFTPAEFADGTTPDDDWRRLGIAISRVKLDHAQTSLSRIATQGVYPRASGDAAEWTNGNAAITIPPGTKSIVFALQAFPKQWIFPA